MQRLKNLFGKENIKIYQIPKEKSFKIEIDLIGVKNGDKYKVDLDFALSIIGKPNLKNIAKKSIDGVIKEIIKYIKSFDYTFYTVKDIINSKEELIKKLRELC